MRSATILALAGLASASADYYVSPPPAPKETEYSTQLVTVTSCAPDVPDCPAESTVISSSFIPLTTQTIYETKVYTVSKCADDVPDCPYKSYSEVVVTETIAVSTTICPVTEAHPTPTGDEGSPPVSPPYESSPPDYPEESAPPSYPPPAGNTKPAPPPAGNTKPAPPPGETGVPPKPTGYPPLPVPSAPPAVCPSVTVKAVVYTKYETATNDVPCVPEATLPVKPVPPPQVPTGSNATSPAIPIRTTPVEAGAAGVSGSGMVAALAAVAAYAFA